MTNVINFEAVRSEKLAGDLQRLAAMFNASQNADLLAARSVGFELRPAGQDRWGDPIYSVVHEGNMIVDGRAELDLSEGLELVRELMSHCTSPDQYRQHAKAFSGCVAELHAEADSAIEAANAQRR